MQKKLFLVLLALVGLINFIPVIGLFSASQITSGYGVELNSLELEILLRHRALLFGLLGGLVLVSLFKSKLQNAALLMSGISMLGFMLLAWPVQGLNEPLARVFWIDVAGLICWLLAVLMKVSTSKQSS